MTPTAREPTNPTIRTAGDPFIAQWTERCARGCNRGIRPGDRVASVYGTCDYVHVDELPDAGHHNCRAEE